MRRREGQRERGRTGKVTFLNHLRRLKRANACGHRGNTNINTEGGQTLILLHAKFVLGRV